MRRILGLAAGLLFALAGAARRPFRAQADHADLPLAGRAAAPTCTCASWPRSPRRHLGQPVVIENRPGGSGMNGPATMAKTAKPDGYTISQLAITAFRVPHMQKVDWDPLTDFSYIIGVSGYTFGIVVKADSPFKTFQDLHRLREGEPGQALLRHAGHRHLAAPGDGGDRAPRRTSSSCTCRSRARPIGATR